MFILYFSGVYEHIRNRASLSDTYPYFDATSERNVTSFVGQVTHLHCTVRDIGDRTVSEITFPNNRFDEMYRKYNKDYHKWHNTRFNCAENQYFVFGIN